MRLRLIADDLTGALDAAAPFASLDAPVHLLLRDCPVTHEALTLSTESRDLSEPEAVARIRQAMQRVASNDGADVLWFKKVDSVLRGHPLAETLAMLREGGFQRCVFAPAFPELGRVTRGGRQFVRTPDGGWQETTQGDLRAAFQHLAPGLEIHVVDAASQPDLRAATLPFRHLPGTLWAGSRGLAEALAPGITTLPRPPVGLFVLGTSHPATRAQAQAVRQDIRSVGAGVISPRADQPVLLDPVPESRSATETAARLRRDLGRLEPPSDGSAILVTGGDCLSLVLETVRASALECLGECAPGLPLSRVIGGTLDGVLIVSKSGGFGAPDTLRAFVRRH